MIWFYKTRHWFRELKRFWNDLADGKGEIDLYRPYKEEK